MVKKVYYYSNVNLNNFSVPTDAGELIGANISWLRLENLSLAGGSVGVELAYSSHIFIENNTIRDNTWNGMYLSHVENATIKNSTVRENRYLGVDTYYYTGKGIVLKSTSNVIIENNSILMNEEDGVFIGKESSYTLIIGNVIAENGGYGVNIGWNGGENNTIYANTFYYNYHSGDDYGYYSQAHDGSKNNIWYNNATHRGNYWRDWANNNDTNDQNPHDGIVDWAYYISGGAEDKYPLKNKSEAVSVPPTAPRALYAISGDGYIMLEWDAPEEEGTSQIMGYRIYRNGTLIAEVSNTSYIDDNVIPGINYTYYVRAVNAAGESARSNEVSAAASSTVPEFSQVSVLLAIVIILAALWKRK